MHCGCDGQSMQSAGELQTGPNRDLSTHFRDISEIKPLLARPRPPPPHPGRLGCRATRSDHLHPTALFIWPLNGPAGGAAGGPPGEIGGSRASEGRSDGLVGAPSPQGDGAGRRDGRNEGLGGLGARAPGTGGGARAGPSGATAGGDYRAEGGPGGQRDVRRQRAPLFDNPPPILPR